MYARTTDIQRRKKQALAALLLLAITCVALLVPTGAGAATASKPKPSKPRPATHLKPKPVTQWMPHIGRTIVPTRTDALGAQLATWYGPGFFGHGTACGGTLTAQTWGIAHRTLPCGTLVTLKSGSRSVTVPVIDRGPFSGATVDLTSRTKTYLGFVSGNVTMTKVSKYRLVPLPKPVSGIVALQ